MPPRPSQYCSVSFSLIFPSNSTFYFLLLLFSTQYFFFFFFLLRLFLFFLYLFILFFYVYILIFHASIHVSLWVSCICTSQRAWVIILPLSSLRFCMVKKIKRKGRLLLMQFCSERTKNDCIFLWLREMIVFFFFLYLYLKMTNITVLIYLWILLLTSSYYYFVIYLFRKKK